MHVCIPFFLSLLNTMDWVIEMVTAVRSINSFAGWEFLLAGLVVCSVASLLVIRMKTQVMIAVLIQLILLESSDIVWTFSIFQQVSM